MKLAKVVRLCGHFTMAQRILFVLLIPSMIYGNINVIRMSCFVLHYYYSTKPFFIAKKHPCDRVCKKGENMVCKYEFKIELYTTMGKVWWSSQSKTIVHL